MDGTGAHSTVLAVQRQLFYRDRTVDRDVRRPTWRHDVM